MSRFPAAAWPKTVVWMALITIASTVSFATCIGADPCRACKNCKYCNHCAKQGGTCGVCKNSA